MSNKSTIIASVAFLALGVAGGYFSAASASSSSPDPSPAPTVTVTATPPPVESDPFLAVHAEECLTAVNKADDVIYGQTAIIEKMFEALEDQNKILDLGPLIDDLSDPASVYGSAKSICLAGA